MLVTELLVTHFAIGIIFLTAGFSKILSISSFADDIAEYQLLSKGHAKLMSYLLPIIEIMLGAFCAVGLFPRITSVLIAFVLIIFSFAIVLNLIRGRRFNCHCFGSANSMIGPMVIVRNLLLIALSIFLALKSAPIFTISSILALWEQNILYLKQLTTFVPIVGNFVLILSIIYLLSEADAAFTRVNV